MRNQKGSSYIEFLIVFLVISIIFVIAFPKLQSYRYSANAASAISTLRVFHNAQVTYSKTAGAGNYAGLSIGTTQVLSELANYSLIEKNWKRG